MVEAVMLWNEPNNKSHWDFEIDPTWTRFGQMVKCASQAVAAERKQVTKVLGGISPIDPGFIENMREQGVLSHMDAVAVHGFPLDWNHWQLSEWPEQIGKVRAVTDLPIWVSEVGVSSFGAEEVQEFGLQRTYELIGKGADAGGGGASSGRNLVERIHWYSLFDLPRTWPATTRHREAEGSSYYRHFYMGLLREDGAPKRAAKIFSEMASSMGLCQWVHFEDHRLDAMVSWFKRLGVKKIRTGLSWADSYRPGAEAWFDTQMKALEPFDVTLTYCFTPEHKGERPHHTSPPRHPEEFAEFCARMTRRYVEA